MKRISFFAITTLCLLSACVGDDATPIRNYPDMPVEQLTAKRIPIHEVLKPADLLILDDYLVFLNERISGEDCFFVFSKKDFSFLYSFGHLGQGVGEFTTPRFIYNTTGNICAVSDAARGKASVYSLSDEEEKPIDEHPIARTSIPAQIISYVSDSLLLLHALVPPEGVEMYSYNYRTNVVLDTLRFDTGIREEMGAQYNLSLDDFQFANQGNQFVVVFTYLNNIVTGAVRPDGQFDPVDFKSTAASGLAPKLMDNVAYYMFPVMTSNYIYAQYYGRLFKYMQPFPVSPKRIFDFIIEVYDRDKRIVRQLHLDSDILRFRVDERTDKLYTWSMFSDFDNLLEYDLSSE
jgi:hypothetical protein